MTQNFLRCAWSADDVRCDQKPLPDKTLCKHHEWLSTLDPAWRQLLDHLGRLLAREYIAGQIEERTGVARDTALRLLRW